jgi:hypothetical protein
MRKTTIVSAIIACISLCLFAASAVFIKWSRTDDGATPSIIITSILAIAIVDAAAIALALIFDKKHEMILIAPIVSLFALTIMFTKGINELLGDNGASIIDFISPSSNNPTVLALLLAILFIVAVILVLSKKYKFASIIAVSYASLLIVTSFNNLSNIFFVEKNLLYLLSSLGLLFALVSLIVYLIAPFVANNDIVKKEKAPAAVEETKTEETNEEASAEEEKAEEANEEVPAEEEKKEETNNDPFKNQYSSSSSIFDVQEDADKKQD